ncbi:hypothetical protein HKX48_002569 [Thoreauomyces humboldtii]|nr:hypothetical protein HKX48_002569 [Thoreauomyces humboldtii]
MSKKDRDHGWKDDGPEHHNVPPPPGTFTSEETGHRRRWSSTRNAGPPMPPNTIWFYHKFQDYYEFTNFYPAPIRTPFGMFPTSEHLYQALKFTRGRFDTLDSYSPQPGFYGIRTCDGPREAFDMAHAHHDHVRPDWEERKFDAMSLVLRQKFDQHSDLRNTLMRTGDKYLAEHTANDLFWGDGGGDGSSGGNHLGEMLMRLRESYQQQHRYNLRSGLK